MELGNRIQKLKSKQEGNTEIYIEKIVRREGTAERERGLEKERRKKKE